MGDRRKGVGLENLEEFAAAAAQTLEALVLRAGNFRMDFDEIGHVVVRLAGSTGQGLRRLAEGLTQVLLERLPHLEKDVWFVIDVVFTPRAVLQQIMAAAVLQAGLVSWQQVYVLVRRAVNHFTPRGRMILKARAALHAAPTYEDWKRCADYLDSLEGHDRWRQNPDSSIYDKRILRRQIDELETLMAERQIFDLMFRLRGGLARNMYGLLHEGLFSRAQGGTKLLVEQYHSTVAAALRFVAEHDDLSIPLEAKLAFFNEIRHAYGRTALLLSGGAAMGFYHVGVVKALVSQGLLPRVISGASAGSIVVAMVGVRTDEELQPLYKGERISLNFFLPHRYSPRNPRGGTTLLRPPPGHLRPKASFTLFFPPALRWVGDAVLTLFWHNESLLKMDTEHFRSVLRGNIGLYTFQEAFDRTGRIINITVSPKNRTDPPRLLNYLTAPHVLVWSAAVASSSVPGVFESSPLYVKESDGVIRPETAGGETFADGSMEADLPMAHLSELFNVNHFVVSQVNPHATLLSTLGLTSSMWAHPVLSMLVGVVRFLKEQIRTWYQHFVELVGRQTSSTQWILRQGLTQLLTQEYEGREQDCTLWPWRGREGLVSSFVKMLQNPTMEEFEKMVAAAEGNTYSSIAKIRSHCAVEQQFERCIQIVRRKLTTERAVERLVRDGTTLSMPKDASDGTKGLSVRGRVPSFYTSPSLVKLSGLAVADTVDIEERDDNAGFLALTHRDSDASSVVSANYEVIQNMLNGDAARPGLDIDSVDEEPLDRAVSAPSSASDLAGIVRESQARVNPNDVIKTSSMANFYYRRSRSEEDLLNGQRPERSNSVA